VKTGANHDTSVDSDDLISLMAAIPTDAKKERLTDLETPCNVENLSGICQWHALDRGARFPLLAHDGCYLSPTRVIE